MQRKILIFAAGTGHPYFTTDTGAALRAVEMEAQCLFKATKVDGVYNDDPHTNPKATKFDYLTYQQVLTDKYRVMDLTAVSFCMENHLPILVFDLMKPGNLLKAIQGENVNPHYRLPKLIFQLVSTRKVFHMSAEVLKEVEEKMDKACEVLVNDMKGLRTDRATPALVDNIRVEYYGSPTPLKQIANVSIPEPRILIIKPFDASSLKNIEKAILKSDLGITPANDGKMLRLTVPVLSEERRLQLINQVKDLTEKAKVAIRNIRRDANKKADQLEKDKLLSEDENKKLQESIQKTTKSHEDEVDKLAEEKKKEILK